MDTYAIAALISVRQHELGISTGDLIRRIGFKNTSKGVRRLEALRQGDLTNKFLLDALPHAFDLPAADVQEAIRATMDQIAQAQRAQAEAEERRYRERFVPHLIIVPKRDRPSPIFVVALIGAERILRRDFDLTRDPDTFVEQALAMVPTSVAAWGETAGFTVNFTPDHAVQFDKQGNPVATFPKAVRPGEADLTLRNGRSIVGLFRATTDASPRGKAG